MEQIVQPSLSAFRRAAHIVNRVGNFFETMSGTYFYAYMIKSALLLIILPALCHGISPGGQVSPTTQSCRILLVGGSKSTGSFSIAEFSLHCWTGSNRNQSNNSHPGVVVRLGKSLLASIDTGANVRGVADGWQAAARPPTTVGQDTGEASDGAAPPDYNTSEYAPNHDDGSEDWGIDILDAPDLELVDSVITGVPLSSNAPLLQCINCSFLSVRNTILENLHYNANRSAFGAVRATGVRRATVDALRCVDVRGAVGWACIALQLQLDAPVEIRDSHFAGNALGYTSNLLGSSAYGQSQLLSPAAIPSTSLHHRLLSSDRETVGMNSAAETTPAVGMAQRSADESGSLILRQESVPKSMRWCNPLNEKDVGFGAILLAYALGDELCNHNAGPAMSVMVERTVITNNVGMCGAGIAVISKGYCTGGSASVQFVKSNISHNKAESDGGGVYLHAWVGVAASMTFSNDSTLSSNSARGSGGGAAVFSTELAGLSFVDSEVSLNSAAGVGGDGGGGGVYISTAPNVTSITVHNTNISWNHAIGFGGGLYISIANVGDTGLGINTVRIDGGSTLLSNNASQSGGAIHMRSPRTIGSIIVDGSSLTGNMASTGGALSADVYADIDIAIKEFLLTGGSLLTNNVARGGNGGAVSLNATRGQIASIRALNVTVSGNLASGGPDIDTAVGHGGGIYARGLQGPVQGVEIGDGSMFANNTAWGHGGAIMLQMDGGDGTIGGLSLNGSSFISNTAMNGDGGALYFSQRATANLSSLLISGATVISNTAGCSGGGLFIKMSSHATDSDGATITSGIIGSVTITSSTVIVRNIAASKTSALCKSSNSGGAIYLGADRIDLPVVVTGGSSIINNSAVGDGGAIYVEDFTHQVGLHVSDGSIISGNNAGNRGGFLYMRTSFWSGVATSIKLESGAVASYNRATYGGFLCLYPNFQQDVQLTLSASQLLGNTADFNGGAVFVQLASSIRVVVGNASLINFNSANSTTGVGSGGALYLVSRNNIDFVVTGGSTLSSNKAALHGGVCYTETTSGGPTTILVGGASRVVNNTAISGDGGAFAVRKAGGFVDVNVTGQSQIEGNQAISGHGGAMRINVEDLDSPYCSLSWDAASTLSYNSASSKGGGIYVDAAVLDVYMLGAAQWVGNTAQDDGGALYAEVHNHLDSFSSVLVRGNSCMSRNRAKNGGAFYVHGFVDVDISENSSISSNTADFDGGAAFLAQLPAGFHLESCTVANNKAARGSGGAFHFTTVDAVPSSNGCPMCFFPSTIANISASKSIIFNNTAGQANGGVFYVSPHVTCCADTTVSIIIHNSTFQENSATGAGGVLALYDASNAKSLITVTSSVFERNSAGGVTGEFTASSTFGGALMVWREIFNSQLESPSCHTSVNDTRFDDNNCNGGTGGAVMLISCGSSFQRCNFRGNHATLSGGALASLQLARTSSTLGLTALNLTSSRGIRQHMSLRRRMLLRASLDWRHPWLQLRAGLRLTLSDFQVGNEDSDAMPRRQLLADPGDWGSDTSVPWVSKVAHCSFTSNTADLEFGGAVYLYASDNGGRIFLVDSNFTTNKAAQQHAGAAFLAAKGSGTRVLLANSSFTNNTAEVASAGALYLLLGGHASGEVVNVSMSGNQAARSGGGSILDVRSDAVLLVQNLTAGNNYALDGNGGALQVQVQAGSSSTLTGCRFHDNYAAGEGGALLLDGNCTSTIDLVNTSMTGNRAGSSGGAVYTAYALKTSLMSGASIFGYAPTTLDTPARPCTHAAEYGRVSLQSVKLDGNLAGGQGGAVFLAPSSTAALAGLSMYNNTACGGGGSLAAQGCFSLSLTQSSIEGSHTLGTGGGMYTHNCRRVLLEDVVIAANQAFLSGGGLTVSGRTTQGQDDVSNPDSGGSAKWDYTSMILHRVQLHGNMAAESLNLSQSCQQNGTVAPGSKGTGGGLFVSGDVVGVLSRSNLTIANSASFGTALASAQRCYPTTSSPRTGIQVIDTDEVDDWRATWESLDEFAARQCWILQLSDTVLPPVRGNGTVDSVSGPVQEDLTLWMDDFLASALHVQCSDRAASLVREVTDERAVRISVRDHLMASLAIIQNSTLFLAGQVFSFVVNHTISTSAGVSDMSTKRFLQLTDQLSKCAISESLNSSQRVAAIRKYTYIGLPATSIGLHLPNKDLLENSERLSLQAGLPFNLTVQLYDMVGQKVTLGASPSSIQLKLIPQHNSTVMSVNTSLDFLANLDAGLNKSLSVPVINGTATWTEVRAFAWPGLYNLQLTFESAATPYVQVARLERPVEVLACAMGYTLDLNLFNSRASLTGCQECPSGQYGLWKDNRPYLANIKIDTDGFSENATLHMMARYLQTMNETVYTAEYECKTCPSSARCLGGAVIVPHLGYWHSAANSTQIHQCPNPTACNVDRSAHRQFPKTLDGIAPDWDYRTKMLAWCQKAWYSSVVPGAAVRAAYDDVSLASVSESYVLNRDLESQVNGPNGADVDCLLFGLPTGHPNSYMQQQCRDGYTGNLCAACVPGYYVDSDFNCKRCPGVTRTVVLGLISFFSSVILVLFTTVTNLSEGFGEILNQQAQAQPGDNTHPRVELGDVVKVIVLHLQYLIIVTRLSVDYPSIILRCQAVFSAVTGAESYIVYSPSCLQPEKDSAGQALIQWLAGILTPCAVVVMSMFIWMLRYAYPFRKRAAQTLVESARSAWSSVVSFSRTALSSRKRPASSSRSDTHSTCSRENSSIDLGFDGSVASLPISLPQDASPVAQEGGTGLTSIFRDVQVVDFDAAAASQEADDDAVSSPVPDAQESQSEMASPPPLPTAASAALVVDLDGLDAGSPAVRALELLTSDRANGPVRATTHRSQGPGVTEDTLDRLSGRQSMLRSRNPVSPGAPPLLTSGSLYSQQDGIRIRGGPTTVTSGPLGSPSQQYYRHPYETWHRRTPKSLSHMGSTAINDAIKTYAHKLRTLAVQTQHSSHATFMQVDKAMSLKEQLGVVLMAAVFILYPSWAHAALSTFACYPIDDGKGPFSQGQQATWTYGYWVRDMQMQCYSGVHLHVYLPVGVAAVVVFCLLPPVASFLFVWRVRNRLNDTHVRKVYGFLYKRYKPRFIWWETVLQLETLILVSVEVLGRGLKVSYQALLLSAVFTVIALINVSCAALLSRLLVIMEFMSLGTLTLTITLSLYFTIDNGVNPAAENTLAILIITLNVCLMAFFLYVASRHFWPSAVKKVAPKAQAVLRKLSSIGGSNVGSPKAADMEQPPRRACWPFLGCFTSSRTGSDSDIPDTATAAADQPASAMSDAEAMAYPLDRLSDEYSNPALLISGTNSECLPQMSMSKGMEIARTSICLDDRLSSFTSEPAPPASLNGSHVCIQLDEAPSDR